MLVKACVAHVSAPKMGPHPRKLHQCYRRCVKAVNSGDLQFLQSKAPLSDDVRHESCRVAAAGGHLAVLQWLREQGCRLDVYICEAAAENGHLAVLEWARQRGCPWDSSTCAAAARGGHLEVLQFAHQNGCECGPDTCSEATWHGHLSILMWLRQHGCPWDCWTSIQAAVNNHLELLRWARQQQPPCPLWSDGQIAYVHGCNLSPCMLVYLSQQQAPLGDMQLAQAHAAATEMTHAFLSLKAALPDRAPREVMLRIVSLAFSDVNTH